MVVLDTNIVVLYINGEEKIIDWINRRRSKGERFVLSIVMVMELLKRIQQIRVETQ